MNRQYGLLFVLTPAFFLIGCAPPSQADLEKSVREEMQAKHNVNLVSFELKKNDDGSYTGTATADNGDVYDVHTKPPKSGKIEWEAKPSQATLDRKLEAEVNQVARDGIEEKYKSKIMDMNLKKVDAHKYEGTAELENKLKLSVKAQVDGEQIKWESRPVKE